MRLVSYGPRKKIPEIVVDNRALFTDLLWAWGVRMAAVEKKHPSARDRDGYLRAAVRERPRPVPAADAAYAGGCRERFGRPVLDRDGHRSLRELIPEHWFVAAGVG